MTFQSTSPSIVKSIKQRDLLNTWLRLCARGQMLPSLEKYRPSRLADELAEMIEFEVDGDGDGDGDEVRFLIAREGSKLTATYSNSSVDPGQRTKRYLDGVIGPKRYARILPAYRACVARKRPTYSVSLVHDPDGKEVSYERLLLPFGSAGRVHWIIGSYKFISIEGRFQLTNLMGPNATPMSAIDAVIDLDAGTPAGPCTSDDIVELG